MIEHRVYPVIRAPSTASGVGEDRRNDGGVVLGDRRGPEAPPNSVAVDEISKSGVPMRPRVGIERGTSRDRYMIVAKQRALMAGLTPGPEQKRPVLHPPVAGPFPALRERL